MNLPNELVTVFSEAEDTIRGQDWYDDDWSCCSGQWEDPRYSDTIVLKLSRREWSSCFPITLYEGAEIHYAAWVDEKSFAKNEVVFGMHVFGFPMIADPKVRKGDFTDSFRERCRETIHGWGHHDVKRGPRVPYGGTYRFGVGDDLRLFLVNDFRRFASLKGEIDSILVVIREKYR